jgi:hypothetical protein
MNLIREIILIVFILTFWGHSGVYGETNFSSNQNLEKLTKISTVDKKTAITEKSKAYQMNNKSETDEKQGVFLAKQIGKSAWQGFKTSMLITAKIGVILIIIACCQRSSKSVPFSVVKREPPCLMTGSFPTPPFRLFHGVCNCCHAC